MEADNGSFPVFKPQQNKNDTNQNNVASTTTRKRTSS